VATLAVAAWVDWGVRAGWLSSNLQRVVDVGVSYGAIALLALSLYRFPLKVRVPLMVALVVALRVMAVFTDTFTDVGHLVAAGVGFALYPLARGAAVDARRAARWVRLPVLTARDEPGDETSTVSPRGGTGAEGADGGGDRLGRPGVAGAADGWPGPP